MKHMKSVLNEVPEVFVQQVDNPKQMPDPLQTHAQGNGVPLTMVSPVPVGWSSHVLVALSEDVLSVLWSFLPAPEEFRCPQLVLYLCAQFPLVSDLCPFQAMHRNVFQGAKGFKWEK